MTDFSDEANVKSPDNLDRSSQNLAAGLVEDRPPLEDPVPIDPDISDPDISDPEVSDPEKTDTDNADGPARLDPALDPPD